MEVFEQLESEVRVYSRVFPAVFATARGHCVTDEQGKRYVDFFSGAGALNYGHNNPYLKEQLLAYLAADGVLHSLDMATSAKRDFLERFQRVILAPRGLDYKVQFCGPTGTNAVEAALKLARKVTGRRTVVFFTQAYHGVTLGSLAVTGNAAKRRAAGVPLSHAVALPFDGYLGPGVDTLALLERMLEDGHSGLDRPAAVILETVQAEGGVNVASWDWLRRLERLVRKHDIPLIVDEIQVGCGRTGPFFSFEPAGIRPDLVCLSKSISGFGLPMAIVLIRPDLDRWEPGEHNGTFRGFNLSFVTGAAALSYWEDDAFQLETERKGKLVADRLADLAARYLPEGSAVRGRGLIQGLDLAPEGLADRVSRRAFERGLILETAGPGDRVLKVLPPLTIDDEGLAAGLGILEESLRQALAETPAGELSMQAI
ncbi:MAG TPA: diaminobutyrate--2-oxoglutarate transaminase [Thermoanaerobaculia bacterium]|nr:diaminobutyrate--2-oxoglutarate transaminase [Thermoanaerobaculia bacterium]